MSARGFEEKLRFYGKSRLEVAIFLIAALGFWGNGKRNNLNILDV
jgi:hypothetical protein